MRIKAAWDSGPYGYYYPAQEGDNGQDVFEADEALLAKYNEAEKAFNAVEDELRAAYEIQRDALRKVKR